MRGNFAGVAKNRIGICAVCSTISANIRAELERRDGGLHVEKWRKVNRDHRRVWKGSRMAATDIVERCRLGERCKATGLRNVCILIDAMENAKLKLPWFARRYGKETELPRMEQRVVAVIVPGVLEYYAVLGPELGHGPNVTIECLVRGLLRVQAKMGVGYSKIEQLDLFLDNTVAENKCTAVPGSCAL